MSRTKILLLTGMLLAALRGEVAAQSLGGEAQAFSPPQPLFACATAAASDDDGGWLKDDLEAPEKKVIDCREQVNWWCWECDRSQRTFCCRTECEVICRRDEKGYCIPG